MTVCSGSMLRFLQSPAPVVGNLKRFRANETLLSFSISRCQTFLLSQAECYKEIRATFSFDNLEVVINLFYCYDMHIVHAVPKIQTNFSFISLSRLKKLFFCCELS